MNRILIILTIDPNNLPSDFSQLLKHEREVVAQWKEDGILEQLFLRPTRNGAILILKNIDEAGAHELIKTLPFYKLKTSLEIIPMLKDAEIWLVKRISPTTTWVFLWILLPALKFENSAPMEQILYLKQLG